MAYVAGIEVIGGLALIIGFATGYIAALDVLIMAGATIKVKYAAGFMGNTQMAGYELELAFLSMALFLVINGGKWLSIDHLIIRKHSDKTH
jgi:putative oxidoreductase